MKTIPVREAQGQLGHLMAEACRGELIVLTDGDKKVRLEPGASLDLEQDSPELEAELLKAASGPFRPYREGDLREIADRALRDYRAIEANWLINGLHLQGTKITPVRPD